MKSGEWRENNRTNSPLITHHSSLRHCYWLADLCEDDEIPFTLGHALYMKAIHGGKAKNDRIDAVYHVWSKQQAFDLRRFFA